MQMNLDDKAAAKALGMAVQTLRNWRCQRKGPAYIKLGRSVPLSNKKL
jgi:DNA-binding transcriptional regulator YiaG